MKTRRSKRQFSFILAGLLIGLFLTLQLRSPVVSVSSYPLDEYEFQLSLVQTFIDEQIDLETRLNELNLQVEEAEESVSNLYSSVDAEYLQGLKKTLGLTEVSGQGIEIVLDDSEGIEREDVVVDASKLIQASDLRDIINLLRTFPHEGIAINEQRIVAATAISGAGNSILINNFHVAPPFTIKVITDLPISVLQQLSNQEVLPSLYDRVDSNGLEFKFKEGDEMTLPAYIGGYSTYYINSASE
tara:strand:- start:33 stop:764 length:732 start_codon:yes stop_codon:yes gene_type:complete